ncbi:radical SAM protein [Streptomyces sp. SID13726]|uniref:radical SAM/SPASM domain-containing protein n=1 Tax=Streptomyces sp. SID13726 TaxID=2706058 RepID=UPI0013B98396|nr:radical SAM protein [Streptomyces sp. SID13726]NEB03268.1 radical SAM protein [Streptomyces sp. SID13726]
MTTVTEAPVSKPFAGINVLELEITGKCQLTCTHCLSESSPQASHGNMTPADWRAVIVDAAALGIPQVQLIGGEPTVNPYWIEYTDLALSLGLRVQIYSNLFHVRDEWWPVFERDGVTLGTSYYSDDPAEHDKITGRAGSYARTRSNIREALVRAIVVRVGIVAVLPGQRVNQARAELRSMGVAQIQTDRARAVGRSALPGQTPTVDELCGNCGRGRAAVLPDGDLSGCVLSRFLPTGNVRERRLADILGSPTWSETIASIPPRSGFACTPDDSGDCDPANTEACNPAYDD